jgi:chromosome segregation ATPase
VSLTGVEVEPEEMSARDMTRTIRDLVKRQLETHSIVHALRKFVHETDVVPELEELDKRLDEAVADIAELKTSVSEIKRDVHDMKGGLGALITIARETQAQQIAIARHWDIAIILPGAGRE